MEVALQQPVRSQPGEVRSIKKCSEMRCLCNQQRKDVKGSGVGTAFLILGDRFELGTPSGRASRLASEICCDFVPPCSCLCLQLRCPVTTN